MTNVSAAIRQKSLAEKLRDITWSVAEAELDARGHAILKGLLSQAQCAAAASLYQEAARFRKTIDMGRYNFGQGEYKYFSYPLPDGVAELRAAFYAPLSALANRWNAAMGMEARYPATHAEFLRHCRAAGQDRPTPLMLCYGPGDYNCLHQDLYGDMVFPFQAVFLLSAPQRDFTGGEFVLTEQRPRMQSRPYVVPLAQGDAVIFPVRYRPVQGGRGVYRVAMRHGVSQVLSGRRQTLGIIFHDAQ